VITNQKLRSGAERRQLPKLLVSSRGSSRRRRSGSGTRDRALRIGRSTRFPAPDWNKIRWVHASEESDQDWLAWRPFGGGLPSKRETDT
jgi:hypothetical protein